MLRMRNIAYTIMMRRQPEWRRNVSMCASRAAFNAITLEGRTLTTSMTPDSKSQLFGHLGAQRLPIVLGILLRIPAEFQNGDENGKGQAAQQHHKHSADVLHTQSIRLWFLVLLVATADFYKNNAACCELASPTSHLIRVLTSSVLPPLVVKYLDGSFFLQLENR